MWGGLAAAHVDLAPKQASDFEVYRSMRTAETIAKASPAYQQPQSELVATTAFDEADDYIKEIFGTPVPSNVPAAEAVVKNPLKSPLPELYAGEYKQDGNATFSDRLELASVATINVSRNLLWPMRGGRVTSRFGMRWGRMHQGTDISAPYGTPITAAADGKVVFSGWKGGYGKLVIVDHGNGSSTKYGHCSQLLAHVGQVVHQGQIIGKVGSTGHSTGPHLHYEVIRSGKANNPEKFTRRR